MLQEAGADTKKAIFHALYWTGLDWTRLEAKMYKKKQE